MSVLGSFIYPGQIVNSASLSGKVILTNGLEAYKYNPITNQLLPLVLRPFRGTMTLTSPNAGALNGVYVYCIVPYNQNEDEEGEHMKVHYTTSNLLNKKVLLNRTNLRRDSPEITHWRVYRTIAGDDWPTMARIATVAWATTTYEDNALDITLDFENQPVNEFIYCPTPKPFICTHGSRVFMYGDIPYATGQVHVINGSKTVSPVGDAVFGFWCEGREIHVEQDGRSYSIDEYDPTTGNITLTENYTGSTDTSADYRICGSADDLIFTEEYYENEWPPINIRPIVKKENDKPSGMISGNQGLFVPKSNKSYLLNFVNYPQLPYSEVVVMNSQLGCISHRTCNMIDKTPVWLSKKGLITGGSALVPSFSKVFDYFINNLDLDIDGTQQMCFSVNYIDKKQLLVFIKCQDDLFGCSRALVWHYGQDKWTIFEFNTEFTCGELVKDTNGVIKIVLGDVNGYVWEYPFGDIDGAPINSTLEGGVDAYTDGLASPFCAAIFDADAQFPTSGLGLAGVPIYVYEGTGEGQNNIISYNAGDTLFFEDCFVTPLDETSKYKIGRIEAQYKTGWMDFGTVARIKDFKYYHVVHEKENAVLQFKIYKDFGTLPTELEDERTNENFGEINLNLVGRQRKPAGGIRAHHIAWELFDDNPNNPFHIYDVAFDYRFGDE